MGTPERLIGFVWLAARGEGAGRCAPPGAVEEGRFAAGRARSFYYSFYLEVNRCNI